jgi:hypothetical protein
VPVPFHHDSTTARTPYDPLPDIAVIIAGVFFTPAYQLPASTATSAGRLMDKLGMRQPPRDPGAYAEVIEIALRAALSGDVT